jgi:hypothetical protein
MRTTKQFGVEVLSDLQIVPSQYVIAQRSFIHAAYPGFKAIRTSTNGLFRMIAIAGRDFKLPYKHR